MPCPPRTFPLRRQLHTIPTDTQPHLTGHLPLPAPTFRGKPGMDARTNGLSPIFADKDTNMEQLAIGSLGELPKAAEAVITASGGRGVVAFFGAMGAGKTTLIREICTQLGVADNVTSPTFALVNHYRSGRGDNIFHFDFYRIEKLDEAYDLGYDEYFDSGALCLVEWPEKIEPLLPSDTLRVYIETTGPDSRKITIGGRPGRQTRSPAVGRYRGHSLPTASIILSVFRLFVFSARSNAAVGTAILPADACPLLQALRPQSSRAAGYLRPDSFPYAKRSVIQTAVLPPRP